MATPVPPVVDPVTPPGATAFTVTVEIPLADMLALDASADAQYELPDLVTLPGVTNDMRITLSRQVPVAPAP